DDVIAAVNGTGVYWSNDNGGTWTELANGLPTTTVNALLSTPSGVVFAGTDSGVFRLDIQTTTWTHYLDGLTTKNILSLTRSAEGRVFAGSDGSGVFASQQFFNVAQPKNVKAVVRSAEIALSVTPN